MDEGLDWAVAYEVARCAVGPARGGAGVWGRIAAGLLPEEAAHAVGASQAVGAWWFRHGGGVPPFDLKPLSGRYLSFREREVIALLKAQGVGVRQIRRHGSVGAVT